jgi:small-conductance mechanosensitive channel
MHGDGNVMKYKEAIIEKNTGRVYYEYFNKDTNAYKRFYVDVPQLDNEEVRKTINKALSRGYNPLKNGKKYSVIETFCTIKINFYGLLLFWLYTNVFYWMLFLWIVLYVINNVIISRLLSKSDIAYASFSRKYSYVIFLVLIVLIILAVIGGFLFLKMMPAINV